MDKSLWQTLGSFDLVHSPHEWILAILLCGNRAQQCRLGLFQDSDFAEDLEDSKSTSSGILCIFGSHTFVPISWMCKKQTSISHSSTEAEIISLDVGLRMDGIPALTLWDIWWLKYLIPYRTEVMDPRESYGETRQQSSSRTCITPSQSTTPTSFQQTLITLHPIQRVLIPVLGCMSLDRLFDRINLYPQIQIRYIDTKHQLADMLTEGNFYTWWVEQSSSFDKYQPFQHHLLYQEFQLDKLGEEDSKSKRRRVQVATSNDEYVFLFYCDKFFRRIDRVRLHLKVPGCR